MSAHVNTIHIIAGPTAGGKSARALTLAAELDGEIINCDSMQVYDDLPILTAHPSAEDKTQAPHHLYGTRHPNQTCSAGNWREDALPLIAGILERGKIPIVVGGTGLYIKALTEGLSPVPDIPEDIRRAAVEKQQQLGNPAFHAALAERDPEMAARFHPYHTARLVRAWEVLEATGKSLAEWQKLDREGPPAHWAFEIHKIIPERAELRERCDRRFERMMELGVLAEVEAFTARVNNAEVRADAPLTKALGYIPLQLYIDGKLSRDEAVERAQAETRQYAKRQVTWFRHQL